jgi:hypothetical protein
MAESFQRTFDIHCEVCVDPDEKQPSGSSGRTITLQLSRDSLILIAALAFLGIAILLALFFPTDEPPTPVPDATRLAQAATPTGEAQTTTIVAIPPSPETATGLPIAASETPEQPGGYPSPGVAETPQPTETAVTVVTIEEPTSQLATETPLLPLPTFQPDRSLSTSEAASRLTAQPESSPSAGESATQPTTAGGGLQPSPYPPPGAVTATPTTLVFNPPTITPQRQQTAVRPPTPALPPTPAASPTEEPTEPPDFVPTRTPAPPRAPTPTRRPVARAPTAIPVDVLRGSLRWTPANGPIILRRDQQLVPGATLIIEPGTEVRMAPGVSFFVEGTLYGLGQPGQPVRFVGSESQRWEGIFGRAGSNIALEHTEIRGGGAGGTVLTSEGGNLVLHGDHIYDNGGHIAVSNSRLEMRDNEISGNDMPYGAAAEATYENGGFVIMSGNRIGGNRMAPGAPPVQINNQSSTDAVVLDLQRNLLVGQDGPDLVLFQDGPFLGGLDVRLPDAGPFVGGMTCNALLSGANGLSIRSNTTQVPRLNLNVRDNAIEDHSPPIVPIYTQPYNGIGRGATSEIEIDMTNNWWDSPAGPYEPDRHADGRGDAVGDTIAFSPWLESRPECAPNR